MRSLAALAERQQTGFEEVCRAIPNVPFAQGTCRFTNDAVSGIARAFSESADFEISKRTAGEAARRTAVNTIFPLAQTLDLADLAGGVASKATYVEIFSFTQYIFVSLLEMALFLTALFSPVAIALTLMPGQLSGLVTWSIAIITIGLAKVSYVVIIGFVAVQLSAENSPKISDIRIAPGARAVCAGGGAGRRLRWWPCCGPEFSAAGLWSGQCRDWHCHRVYGWSDLCLATLWR